MISWLILLWVFVGVLVIIHEVRIDMDIELFTLIFLALIGSVLGPIMLIRTLYRKGNFVIFKKYTK